MIVSLLIAALLVTDPSGDPIPGAWIGWNGGWYGFTDSLGVYSLTGHEPDRITVHATGFRDWTGSLSFGGGTVVLEPFPVSSGGVVRVTAEASSFRSTVPSLVTLGRNELQELARGGGSRFSRLSPGIAAREYGGGMPVLSISSRGNDPGMSRWMIDGHRIESARSGLPAGMADPLVFGSLEVGRGGAGAVGGGTAGFFNYRTEAEKRPWRFLGEADHRGGVRLAFSGDIPPGRLGLAAGRNMGSRGSEAFSFTGLLTRGSLGFLVTGAGGETESPEWTVETDGTRRQGQLDVWGETGPFRFRCGAGGMVYESTVPQVISDTHTDFGADFETGFSRGNLAFRTGAEWRGLESSAAGSRYRLTPWAGAGWERRGPVRASLWSRIGLSDGTWWWNARAAVQSGLRVVPWAAVSRDISVPTFNDLYWPSEAFARGNPDLLPQNSLGAEAGVRFFPSRVLSAGITLYITSTEQLIMWLPGPDGVWSPGNTGKALSRGIELEGAIRFPRFGMGGSATFSSATDETPGTVRKGMRLPYRPGVTGGGFIEADPLPWLSVSLGATGQGRRFTNRTETLSLPPYLLIDCSVTVPASEAVRLRGWICNAAGITYMESGGYPGKPRTFGLTFETGETR